MNLAGELERRLREAPARLALAFEGERHWSYAQLASDIGARARALRAFGVGRGDRVALCVQNGPESVLQLYACWTLGAVPVTVSALYGPADFAAAFAKTQPRHAIVDAGLAQALESAGSQGVRTAMLGGAGGTDGFDYSREIGAAGDGAEAPIDLPADAESVILFTGGTTGSPKAVAMTHGGTRETMTRLAQASKGRPPPYALAPPEASPNLVALPLFHSGGQQALLFSFFVGRPVVLMQRFRAERLGELVVQYRVDNLFLLPTMVYDLVHCQAPLDLRTVRSVLVAGGAVDTELRAKFERRFSIPMLSNYGSTEMGHVAGWTAADVRAGQWRPGSAGRVYAGVDVEIRQEDGRVCGLGEDGEIWVRTSLTRGYVGGGDVLAVDGWVRSGDVGHLDATRVLYLVGRKRELIKCGGFQVWPTEVEDALRDHDLVADVAVVGIDDPRLGQVPKAFVVPRARPAASLGEPEARALIEHARDRLAHYKAVRSVAFVDALPRTAAGKIDRAQLAP